MSLRILSVLLFVLVLSLALKGQTKKCYYCKEKITEGTYIEVDGRTYHEGHFKCKKCDKSLDGARFYNKNGGYYHKHCYNELFGAYCAHCSEIIDGAYITSNGLKYHKHCYEDNVALKCDVCKGMISGHYLKDHWGNVYHEHHSNETEKCRFCSRLITDKITNGGYKYADGTAICSICYKNTVTDTKAARRIMNSVKGRLKKYGIIINYKDIRLELTDQRNLMRMYSGAGSYTTGFTHQQVKTLNGKVFERTIKIYVLYGMPFKNYIETIAHELMHVWQYLNSPEKINPAFCEGSCNYASYLITSESKDEYSQYLLKLLFENKDPHYGEGFRRVKKLVNDKGVDYWLRYLSTNRYFPPGY